MKVSPGPLRVEVLDPIDTSDWTAERASEHAHQLWSLFQERLGPRQRGVEDTPQ